MISADAQLECEHKGAATVWCDGTRSVAKQSSIKMPEVFNLQTILEKAKSEVMSQTVAITSSWVSEASVLFDW
jgi:hypothetical protein